MNEACKCALTEDRPGGVRVLIVDDIEVHRRMARTLFESFGCEVHEAADGLEGATLARAIAFDLVLMDLNMPVCDGEDAAEMIRSSGASSAATIILHSTDQRARERIEPFDGMVSKPITIVEILSILTERPHKG